MAQGIACEPYISCTEEILMTLTAKMQRWESGVGTANVFLDKSEE